MEIHATILGLVSAFGLGTADFLARFTSRAIGPYEAAAGMLSAGCILSIIATVMTGQAFPSTSETILLAALSGLISALGMIAFYMALTLGQLSFVIPIAATYPIWSVLYGLVFQDLVVTPAMGVAMIATLLGGWIVARYGALEEDADDASDGQLAITFFQGRLFVAIIAIVAGITMVASVYVSGPAAVGNSEIGVFSIARGVGALSIFVVIVYRRKIQDDVPQPLGRWPFVVAVQGALDGTAIFALYMAAATADSALGFVVSSAFGVVTVLLGRVVLKELITHKQWGGIVLAMGGAMALSALS